MLSGRGSRSKERRLGGQAVAESSFLLLCFGLPSISKWFSGVHVRLEYASIPLSAVLAAFLWAWASLGHLSRGHNCLLEWLLNEGQQEWSIIVRPIRESADCFTQAATHERGGCVMLLIF